MKITFEFTDNDKEEEIKAKRMMAADDAFSLLWQIMQTIYLHRHNESAGVTDNMDKLTEIEANISESNLLDLWQ